MTQKTLCGMRPRAKKKHAASGRAWRENVPRYFLSCKGKTSGCRRDFFHGFIGEYENGF